MPHPNNIVLDLSRLALAGDASGARSYLQVLLRKAPEAGGQDAEMREALARLLMGSNAAAATARAARRSVLAPAHDKRALSEGDAASIHVEGSEHSPLTRVEMPGRDIAPVLSGQVQATLDAILLERRAADRLREVGVEPTRSVLLIGAPGVGKTMTARFLAAATGLPLVTLDLAGVMSSLLGQSAQNLRRALDVAARTPCVFLIDEVDALAKLRNDPSDVGELKRLVNVLLLELERWPSGSLLVAATNHPELLDRAFWRRFDRVLALTYPGFRTRQRILAQALSAHGQEISADELALCAAATPGQTGADIVQLVRDAVRATVLHQEGVPVGHLLVGKAMARLEGQGRRHERARGVFCRLATRHLGLSQREVARRLGISHVQVGRLLKEHRKPASNAPPPGLTAMVAHG